MIAETSDPLSQPDLPLPENQGEGRTAHGDLLASQPSSQSVSTASPDDGPHAIQREVPERERPAMVGPDARSWSPDAPEGIRAADLFLPQGTDRSITAWFQRLTGTARPPAEPADAAPNVMAQEEVTADPQRSTGSPVAPEESPVARTLGNKPPDTHPPLMALPRRFIAPAIEVSRTVSAPPPSSVSVAASVPPTRESASPDRDSAVVARADVATAADRDVLPAATGQDAEVSSASGPAMEVRRDESPPVSVNPWFIDPTETIRSDALFQSQGTDRSSAAWIERLTSAARAEAVPLPATKTMSAPLAPEPPAEAVVNSVVPRSAAVGDRAVWASAPTPLAETTRRFLRPLVGVDPAIMPVSRDAGAAATAAAYRADALTDGNVTMLAAGNDDDTPETLGLLAHELTHIARRRDPRFIPPIARTDDRHDQAPGGIASATLLADDEALARRVETRVIRTARAYQAAQAPSPQIGRSGDRSEAEDDRDELFASEPRGTAERREGDEWNGLPAPWESLPDWMSAPAPGPVAATNGVDSAIATAPLAPVAPVVQLAEEERPSEGESATTPPATPHDPNAPVEPDLDALARQVYAILKRRLALERRNAG